MNTTEFAVKLAIHPVFGGGCTLVPDNEYNFEIRKGDEIHMLRPLPERQQLSLLLELAPGTGAAIRALSFGTTSEEALEAEQALDTGGAYYGASPFKIVPGPTGTAVLTVVNDPEAHRFFRQLWFFDVWPESGGPIHRIDPKIYNQGDDPPPRR